LVALTTDTVYAPREDFRPTKTFIPAATVHPRPARTAKLRRAVQQGATVELRDANGASIAAPELTELLQLALNSLANGDDVMLLTGDTELTPTEAGQVLGCSRQYVNRLIDLGEIPARNLPESSHRRIRATDITEFQNQRNKRTTRVADAINALTDAGASY
jgi:excisionase family DNA binding protein